MDAARDCVERVGVGARRVERGVLDDVVKRAREAFTLLCANVVLPNKLMTTRRGTRERDVWDVSVETHHGVCWRIVVRRALPIAFGANADASLHLIRRVRGDFVAR